MVEENAVFGGLAFDELEQLFGLDNARVILTTLEKFEGISAPHVAHLSYTARLDNVISVMKENIRFHTMH